MASAARELRSKQGIIDHVVQPRAPHALTDIKEIVRRNVRGVGGAVERPAVASEVHPNDIRG